jgi:hypothetical protein
MHVLMRLLQCSRVCTVYCFFFLCYMRRASGSPYALCMLSAFLTGLLTGCLLTPEGTAEGQRVWSLRRDMVFGSLVIIGIPVLSLGGVPLYYCITPIELFRQGPPTPGVIGYWN